MSVLFRKAIKACSDICCLLPSAYWEVYVDTVGPGLYSWSPGLSMNSTYPTDMAHHSQPISIFISQSSAIQRPGSLAFCGQWSITLAGKQTHMSLSLLIMGKKGWSSHLHCQARTPGFSLQWKVSRQPQFSSYRKVLSQPQQVETFRVFQKCPVHLV